MSILEIRFYLGIVASFIFLLIDLLLFMFGRIWEGISLLIVLVILWPLALYTGTKRRCPHCGRLYVDSSYTYCPFCGYPLKSEHDDDKSNKNPLDSSC
jgi:hypothetical protein